MILRAYGPPRRHELDKQYVQWPRLSSSACCKDDSLHCRTRHRGACSLLLVWPILCYDRLSSK